MSKRAAPPDADLIELPAPPRFAALWALLATVLPAALLSLPMLSGKWLVGTMSDQGTAGFAFRDWSARQWLATGHFPMWDPMLMGGIPYVGGTHGDLFYWTSFLRLILPTDTVMNLGFSVHYVIAGMLAYALLRNLKISWIGSVTGALGYELAGLALSYPAPGHDGKLFVTALLPGALLCLNLAIRQRRYWGYAGLALVVGLALVSPHFQMTYYLLIAAGLFAIYATFGGEEDSPKGAQRYVALAIALVAVLVGFGVAWAEIYPFIHYIPYSPRANGYSATSGPATFDAATSYAIPWSHIPEFFIARFTGMTFEPGAPQKGTYWASNPLKLHSEYWGLPVFLFAAVGIVSKARRRLALWMSGIGLLFLLVAMGSATPFYRLWWYLPYVKQTRAPGMAVYVTSLALAVLAGIGIDRLLSARANGWRFERVCLVVGGVIALLGISGMLGAMAVSMARGIGEAFARANGYDLIQAAQLYADAARANADAIRFSGVFGGLAVAAIGALFMGRRAGRVPAIGFTLLLPLIVAADLWRNGLAFWHYQAPARQSIYATDPIIDYLRKQPKPYRVFECCTMAVDLDVYGGAVLMDFDIPQVLGMHSFQLNTYNVLMGGKNEWRFLLSSRRIWDLDGIEYVLLPSGVTNNPQLGQQLPAFDSLTTYFEPVLTNVTTSTGKRADLFKRRTPVPWARLVPAAAKAPDETAAQLIANPQQQPFIDQLVLLPPESPLTPAAVTQLPQKLASNVRVTSWAPERLSLAIEPAASQAAYVVISQNWYPDWHATVDGRAVTPVRGDVTYLVVPVPAGAKRVDLWIETRDFQAGKKVSFASLGLIALGFLVPMFWRREQRG